MISSNESHEKMIIGDIPIYYINLDRSTGRKKTIESFFKNNNITNYKRVEAIDGNNLSKEILSNKYNLDKNPKLNLYDYACALSHLKAIEQVLIDNHDYALIIEDDCNFEYLKYQKEPILNIIDKIKNYEIIKLSSIDHFDRKSLKNEDALKWKVEKKYYYKDLENKIILKNNSNGLQGYIVNKTTCKKIVDNNFKNFLGTSEDSIFKIVNPHVVYPPYFTYYYYKNVKSLIRKGKANHSTQTYSKIFWDNYYNKIKNIQKN